MSVYYNNICIILITMSVYYNNLKQEANTTTSLSVGYNISAKCLRQMLQVTLFKSTKNSFYTQG